MFYNFDRIGKGINPNTPKKTGFALFVDIIYREFWAMLSLNLIFLLYCIPIVTIGASYAAMNSLLVRMVRDKPVDVWYDFRITFKENFTQGTIIFFLQIIAVCIIMINLEFYSTAHPLFPIVTGIVGIFLGLMNLYLIPLAVSVKLPLKNIFKNSFYLIFLSLKYTLMAGLVGGVFCFFLVWYFPYSIMHYLLFSCVFVPFIICFLTHYGISKYCYAPTEEQLQVQIQEQKEKEAKELAERLNAKKEEEQLLALDEELTSLNKALEEIDSDESEDSE